MTPALRNNIQNQPKHGRQMNANSNGLEATYEDIVTRLVEKWTKTRQGVKLDQLFLENSTKARNTAISMENEDKHLRQLNETQISQAFKVSPQSVLRIVRIGVANSNRGDIFTEWTLTSMNDALFYVDKTFTSNFRGGQQGERIYELVTPDYGTEIDLVDIGTGNGILTSFNINSLKSMIRFTVVVIVNNKPVGSDNGEGTFIGGVTGTVDYQAGAIVVNFAVAPAVGDLIKVEYHFDSEQAANYPYYGHVELKVTKKVFNPRPYPLGYSYTKMVELLLGTTGLGDVEEMLVKAVGDEHAMRRDYKAFQYAKRIALSNPIAVFDADFAAAQEDNAYNHAQRILVTINDVGGSIYNDIKRGTINKIVSGTKALNYIKQHKLWTSDTTQSRVGGSYYAGKLDDIDVYVTPSDPGTITQDEMILTYKNPDEDGEPAMAFGVLTELAAALDYPQFYREGNIASVEDVIQTQPKYCRLMRITNMT